MHLIEKVATIITSDKALARQVSKDRANAAKEYLRQRSLRGGKEYSESAKSYNNLDAKAVASEARKRMLNTKGTTQLISNGVTKNLKNVDATSVNPLTGGTYIENKMRRIEKVNNPNYSGIFRSRVINNLKARRAEAEAKPSN